VKSGAVRTRLDYRHLLRMSDDVGLFARASGALPDREHGYTLDNAARGLVVLGMETQPTAELLRLQETLLAFTAHAHEEGQFHNELGYDRRWRDAAGLGDWWGTALWGLGATTANADRAWVRSSARGLFERAGELRSPSPMAMVFAALGAAEVLVRFPRHEVSRDLLTAAVRAIGPIPADDGWLWPASRLGHANAAVAEVLIAAGSLLPDPEALEDGLRMLDWLVHLQTHRGRLSVVPSTGWAPGDGPPAFDQQPAEVAALASACDRAHAVTGATRWAVTVRLARDWFLGVNDVGARLADRDTGGCCDGLLADGASAHQGAEATLALLSTFQSERHRMNVVRASGDL
jgi:hypothetical protein